MNLASRLSSTSNGLILLQLSFRPLFNKWLDSANSDDLDASRRDVLFESVVCLGGPYGRIAQNGLDHTTAIDIMRWPYAIPSQFSELAKGQLPHVLVILARFIVLFELLPQLWRVSDVAQR